LNQLQTVFDTTSLGLKTVNGTAVVAQAYMLVVVEKIPNFLRLRQFEREHRLDCRLLVQEEGGAEGRQWIK
jgi:hypothetical protein